LISRRLAGSTIPATVWDFVHVALGSTTRRAFAKVLDDTRKSTAFLLPALRRFGAHGIRAERVITDNGWLSLPPHRQGTALGGHPPLHPALHAQDQRKSRTVHPDPAARMAYGLAPPSSNARSNDLPRWLD